MTAEQQQQPSYGTENENIINNQPSLKSGYSDHNRKSKLDKCSDTKQSTSDDKSRPVAATAKQNYKWQQAAVANQQLQCNVVSFTKRIQHSIRVNRKIFAPL